ncbi:yrdC domain-containing protein, mitochondrial [Trichonephila clavata]|uniref:Threonylcarbamoyl-AMP synthase n=1 Tax=Trichonephila clavata TaxID=2740835 RepID=A0A8X6H861_TRICU|nr:yrdC domain-containing protein, mitochondrial [Trichonephila clavata]
MFSVRREMGKIIKFLSNGYSFEETVALATSVLKNGKVIALPTDTIYGVAALAQNTEAVDALCKIKRRDNSKKFVAICVGRIDDIPKWGKVSFPMGILTDLLPGPVTLIMERKPILNCNFNPHSSTVGIRIPNSKFIQSLAVACNEPLALTSANFSAERSTLEIQEFKEMWPYLDLIIDGGVLGECDPDRRGSTVVDLSEEGFFNVVRDGCSRDKTVEVLLKYGLREQT